jgi:ABC-type Fe3+-siderophore transport system permease subunit
MSLLLLGAALASPFAVAAVAAERSDVLDAQSRSFGYVTRRLPRLLRLMAIGAALSALGSIALFLFLQLAAQIARFGLTLGAGRDLDPFAGWSWLFELLLAAWSFTAFWSWVAAAYLILRADVDGTPTDHLAEPRP